MSETQHIRKIAIVGGGTAGWSAACLLGRIFARDDTEITLIESSAIPTVGVGEATIPPIFEFLQLLEIDPVDFVRETQSTFKLAIEFRDWLKVGHSYWHPFGNFGLTIDRRPFHHYWWKNQAEGHDESVADFCPSIALAEKNKFLFPPADGQFPGGALSYALHFDAGLVAKYLRQVSEGLGVTRLDRKVQSATLNDRGHIGELLCDDGSRVAADLYIDCSGFHGLLIEQSLNAGYQDWTNWLPCDRAVAVQSEAVLPRTPYTISTAREAGWQWRIPLQNRVGNGYVYSSAFISDADAQDRLVRSLDGKALADPRVIGFTAGHRKKFWDGNCVSIGLSAGFLEPLESTSIHLIVTGLNRLLDYFPDRNFDPSLQAAYNRETLTEYEHIRDFLLLHYYPNQRVGEPFWDQVRHAPLPDSLATKMEMFRKNGRIISRRRELFHDLSWFFVARGMGITPENYDPLVDIPDFADVRDVMGQVGDAVGRLADAAPTHDQFLDALITPGNHRRPAFHAPSISGFGR
ncbi:tryptophan halogenase [Sphingopyxis sp. BSNA05]|nr:tryptophan halogenase [Sphingopyxis sp. BSNA05]